MKFINFIQLKHAVFNINEDNQLILSLKKGFKKTLTLQLYDFNTNYFNLFY